MDDIEERLKRRNAIIYGSGGYREYRYSIRTSVYCGTCHREQSTISDRCSCAKRRAWREWDRHHDQVALQRMWAEGQWPIDAQMQALNSFGWTYERWTATFKSIMSVYLVKERDVDACTHSLVNEYIIEAEHQDGDKYWLKFNSPADVLADFDLYVEYSEVEAHNDN